MNEEKGENKINHETNWIYSYKILFISYLKNTLIISISWRHPHGEHSRVNVRFLAL